MIDPRDVTVVLQGSTPADAQGQARLAGNAAALRAVLPGARVIFSTWRGAPAMLQEAVDFTVFSDDPGALPPFKIRSCKSNNVNRQIVSSAAGLARVDTPFALKLRSDARLEHRGVLDWHARLQDQLSGGPDRIVTASHFSVDPRMFEQMPLHLSDWFQFGRTERLRRLWSAQPMGLDESAYYDTAAYAPASTHFDRRSRARFPAEQHVWREFARALGYGVPDFHNDARPAVLAEHDRFVAQEITILDADQSGVRVHGYDWVAHSGMQRFNCLSHLDWLAVAAAQGALHVPASQHRALRRRQIAKTGVARAFRACRWLIPALATPPLKQVASVALHCADLLSRRGSGPCGLPSPTPSFPTIHPMP